MARQWAGTVEADALYHTAGQKGQAKQGGKKALGHRPRSRRKKREPGRGPYDKDRPAIIAWVSRQGLVMVQSVKDCTVKTVQKAADVVGQAGSRLYADSASSYQALTGYGEAFVNHRRNMPVVTCMRTGRSVYFPYSSRTYGSFVASETAAGWCHDL